MYRRLSIAVVIPAFNEERAIGRTIGAVPGFVDRVVVVDDASVDATARLARRSRRRRLEVLRHSVNRGVGAAITTGYRRALALGVDAVAVMAGDGQMDPCDLACLLEPIAAGSADYVKGNRFLHPAVWKTMPKARLLGNLLLSLATKIVSGYWHSFDSQCGYTAITRQALLAIDLDDVFPRYGYPNDFLARLHSAGARVADVRVRPIYGPEWRSGISPWTVFYPIAFVLAKAWLRRTAIELARCVGSSNAARQGALGGRPGCRRPNARIAAARSELGVAASQGLQSSEYPDQPGVVQSAWWPSVDSGRWASIRCDSLGKTSRATDAGAG
ncbi:MAG: glycosyltransferase family 2 protein [Pseudomonadota bacterium]